MLQFPKKICSEGLRFTEGPRFILLYSNTNISTGMVCIIRIVFSWISAGGKKRENVEETHAQS